MIKGVTSAVLKVIDKKTIICSAVIVAAGSSSRMKGINKLFASLGSEPLLASTLRVFQQSNQINEIVLVLSKDCLQQGKELCTAHGFSKVRAVIEGGESRAESSLLGLKAISKKTDIVLIHDGDRPFVTLDMIHKCVAAAARWGAAAVGIPVTSTIKSVDRSSITGTVPRDNLYEIQTPQAFQVAVLKASRAVKSDVTYTDDCMAVEALGIKPLVVEGERTNIKITYPEDLIIARAIANYKGG